MQWAMMVPACMAELMAYSGLLALFSGAVSDKEQGKVMGGSGAIWGLTWMLNAMLLGPMSDFWLLLPVLGASLFLLLGALVFLGYRKHNV